MKKLPNENSKKFITVLNKKIETGKLMNALGHMTAGFVGGLECTEHMCFLKYVDGDNGIHPNISHFPFIILKAENSNKIRKLRNICIENNIQYCDFTSTMTVGSSEDQLNLTKNTPEIDLDYYGIILFGDSKELSQYTKKFSLFN